MRIEQIKYFLTVIATGSITNAAQQLFITQQALSDSLKKLEKELGVTLLERAKTGVKATEDGHLFASHASEMMEHYNDFEWALAQRYQVPDTTDFVSGKITVYTTPLLAVTFFPDLLQEIKETYPQLQVQCIEATITDTIKALMQKEGDIGFIFMSPYYSANFFQALDETVQVREIQFDQIVACVSKTSALAKQKHIKMEEFRKLTRVEFGLKEPFFPRAVVNNILMYSTNPKTHEQLIANNMGISSVPKLLFSRLFTAETVCQVPVEPPITVSHYLLLPRQEEAYRPEIKAFVNLLISAIRAIKLENGVDSQKDTVM